MRHLKIYDRYKNKAGQLFREQLQQAGSIYNVNSIILKNIIYWQI